MTGQSDKPSFVLLQHPLRAPALRLAEQAFDIHKRELKFEREFPDLPLEENLVLMVAVIRNRVVGYLSAEILPWYESQWWLRWMVVASDYRRQGIGTSLLGAVASAARDMGSPALLLEPLREGGKQLECFYT